MNSNFSNIDIINFDNSEEKDSFNYQDEIEKFETRSNVNLNFCHPKLNSTELEFGESLILSNLKRQTNCDTFENSINQEFFLLQKSGEIINNSFQNLQKIDNTSFSYFRMGNEDEKIFNNNDIFIKSEDNLDEEVPKKNLKRFTCEYENCKKVYKSKENLKLHNKNVHLQEKPYACIFCDKKFSHRNGKTYHERKLHTKFLPYNCSTEECGLSFASKSSLNYHMKSTHNGTKINIKNFDFEKLVR